MTPADMRVLAVLQQWLASVNQHLEYSDLDDESYWKRRKWVPHKRPSARDLDVAKRRVFRLIKQVHSRIKTGDETFCDSLELMSMVTTMVAHEQFQSFIPLIEPEPKPKPKPKPKPEPKPVPPPPPVRPEPTPPATGPAATPTEPEPEPLPPIDPDDIRVVIADAVRLLNWGRQWHELPALIPNIHDRPPAETVRRVLSEHRVRIEAQARVE